MCGVCDTQACTVCGGAGYHMGFLFFSWKFGSNEDGKEANKEDPVGEIVNLIVTICQN